MKAAAVVAAIVALAFAVAAGGESAVEPEVGRNLFEVFLAKPGVITEVMRPIGSIESADARVEIVAILGYESSNPPDQMRGVRITLESNGGYEQIYLERGLIMSTMKDLAQIEEGIPILKSSNSAPYRVEGTASCWRPERPVRILCPSYRIGPDWSGMTLAVYGGETFSFPDHRPVELGNLLDQALGVIVPH